MRGPLARNFLSEMAAFEAMHGEKEEITEDLDDAEDDLLDMASWPAAKVLSLQPLPQKPRTNKK